MMVQPAHEAWDHGRGKQSPLELDPSPTLSHARSWQRNRLCTRLRSAVLRTFTFRILECFKQVRVLNALAWNDKIGPRLYVSGGWKCAIVGVPWRGAISACWTWGDLFVNNMFIKELKRLSLLRHHGTPIMAHLQLPELCWFRGSDRIMMNNHIYIYIWIYIYIYIYNREREREIHIYIYIYIYIYASGRRLVPRAGSGIGRAAVPSVPARRKSMGCGQMGDHTNGKVTIVDRLGEKVG